MLTSKRTYAVLVHAQDYHLPLQLLSKVDPPEDLDIAGMRLELWHVLCPGAPSSCPRHVDPSDISDVP